MTKAPRRPCLEPGCNVLTRTGRCSRHKRGHDVRRRGSAHARGYTSGRWKRFRDAHLAEYPYCGDRAPGAPPTADSFCRAVNRWTLATDVDHIVRLTGPDDEQFYEVTAVQSLCAACHRAKTHRERRAS